MEGTRKWKRGSFSVILLAVTAILLSALPCSALNIEGSVTIPSEELPGPVNEAVNVLSGGTLNILAGGQITGSVTVNDGGILNLEGGSVTAQDASVVAAVGSVVNIRRGSVLSPLGIWVDDGSDVTVFGTDFDLDGVSLDPQLFYPIRLLFTLSVKYEGDTTFTDLNFFVPNVPNTPISLANPTIDVQIDIKPGSYPNSINLGSNGVVPVAILSTSDFDATLISADTVFLAGAGVAIRGKGNKYLASEEDVNGDGLLDLVVKVETENLDEGTFQDGYAILEVREIPEDPGSVIYWGKDEITIVPPE